MAIVWWAKTLHHEFRKKEIVNMPQSQFYMQSMTAAMDRVPKLTLGSMAR